MTYSRLSDYIAQAHAIAFEHGKAEVASCLARALEHELSAFGGLEAKERREPPDALARVFERQAILDKRAVVRSDTNENS